MLSCFFATPPSKFLLSIQSVTDVLCFSRLPARGVNSVCHCHVFQPFACQGCQFSLSLACCVSAVCLPGVSIQCVTDVLCFSRLPARGVNSACHWYVVFQPFACQECGKAYKSKTALRWHVRSHKTGNLFKCDKLVALVSLRASVSLCLPLCPSVCTSARTRLETSSSVTS